MCSFVASDLPYLVVRHCDELTQSSKQGASDAANLYMLQKKYVENSILLK
jgi:hypothetical protein